MSFYMATWLKSFSWNNRLDLLILSILLMSASWINLYDLKQSPRVWYTKLNTSLLHLGFLLLRMTLPYLFVIFLMGYFLFLSMWMI